MYLNTKWISKVILTLFVTLALAPAAPAQIRIWAHTQSLLPPDEARDVFNAGQRFFDEDRFKEAENKFREVVRRFPRNPIADRADYYLIRTLAQVGKKNEALGRIDGFAKQYPKSRWLGDVQELRIQLTHQIPARAESILIRTTVSAAQPVPSPFAHSIQATVPEGGPVVGVRIPPTTPLPPIPPMPFGGFGFQSSDPEISLQQEIMRAMFRNNADRALEIATERLRADPSDPVVLSSLNALASSRSGVAMSMLLGIVKGSPNAKARRDAIFWLGQSQGDNDSIVDTIVGLLPSLSDDDSEAVAYTLSRMRSDKSINALAAIARDKNKSEKARTNAIFWIGQTRAANRLGLLEDIYKNGMDNAAIRQQVMYALSRTGEPRAMAIMGNIASTDPDIEVRRQAVYWLGQSKSPEANQALENLLRKK
jgi:tetratricopeptide (TPR) repeat protein